MFVCLLDELILGFCYSDLTLETGGFALASTIILVLQANRLIKCASHPYPSLVLPSFNKTTQSHPFINKFDPLSLIFQQKRPTPTYSYPYFH